MKQGILVVGGCGYVGQVLVPALVLQGYGVRVLDRCFFGWSSQPRSSKDVELVTGDMRDPPPGLFDNIGAVINIGGLSNDPTAEYNPPANREMNTEASITLAEHCIRHGIHRYLFASTCSIYDRLDSGKPACEGDLVSPTAIYAVSKLNAEKGILDLGENVPDFCPVILRKGTIFGFSHRMRFDLVVNTFVKDALTTGCINLHCGGEMWRPLIEVRDVAKAYITCLRADSLLVKNQIFNVAYANFRISELGLRVARTLRDEGIMVEIHPDYTSRIIRSYRVSTRKIQNLLGFRPTISVEDSICHMVGTFGNALKSYFYNPRFYNIQWMRLLEEAHQIIQVTGGVFETPTKGDNP